MYASITLHGMQVRTQRSWCRPYGVGLLVIGIDSSGAQLYETCPSGQFWKYKAMAIGARSHAAKTYLERKLDEFPGNGKDELIMHALSALQVSHTFLQITLSTGCSSCVLTCA